jgi:integrase
MDINKNPYLRFKVKLEESERVSLSSQELTDLEELKFNDHSRDLEFARDLFLFSCYTGIRFADVFNLTKSNLVVSKKGEMTLEFRMMKSNKSISLPLHLLYKGKPRKLVEKYNNEYSEFLFPLKSNQHINRQLKLVAVLAGINKMLTYHVARHTFGTNLADILADPYLIKELMGHAKISTSMIYIHNSQERINKKLKDVNWGG